MLSARTEPLKSHCGAVAQQDLRQSKRNPLQHDLGLSTISHPNLLPKLVL